MSRSDAIDTIRMQVMWNRLISVVEEQAQSLLDDLGIPKK